ncbi:MAG: T9SS type A sorting domain-containing protein [Saprospiraceae bacterium]|nr:T9SS type A sorting domain-containing protein [Saprospiraceae bacterium]MCF8251687.1 T9SS type A sorting domain-containing protein [Saprospiraceae bacterium]MCF8282032.1 T9SS type A sorting domain-containing protein [Bacteroidales bacterium]MCF8311248.1 T9SS type A sorting domain-containing protein [Saprospiraceae bacterium]MCF8442050.1 T9SS type A sorting domain-containing protein [Saprospiraceae bacterium]
MKLKLTFIFAFAFQAIASFSQITLTAADVAIVGQSMTQVNDTLPAASIVAGPSGPNQNWDFTGLHEHESYNFATVAPDETPFADIFPTANLAAIENDSAYAYLEKDNNSLRILGIYGSFPTDDGTIELAIRNTPTMRLLQFPATYNDGFSEQYQRIIEMSGTESGLPVDSFRMVSTIQRSVQYDAYGILTTPSGSFQVLRVKETEISVDTSYFLFMGAWTEFPGDEITDIAYNFWTKQNGISFPVASIQADEFGNTVSASWLRDFAVSPTQENRNEVSFDVFPNPCQDQLSLDLPGDFAGNLEVYDFTGRKVATTKIEGHFGSLDASALASGMFVLVLKNEAGKVVGTKKFEVSK